ncbi:MAG: cytochrome c1 [Paracoccaceae bacterium]
MLQKILIIIASVFCTVGTSFAAGDAGHIHDVDFSFEGPFGTYDQMQLQRGLQVYTEVCSACHGLRYVPLRTISDEGGPGLPKNQMKAYVKAFSVNDEGANPKLLDPESGEYRELKPSDNFPVNNAAGAPDLSLMAKGRSGFHGPYGTGINQLLKGIGGPEYIASLLTGYTGKEKEEGGVILYENTAYPGKWIAMAPPIYGDDVSYADGHSTSIHHISEDVSAFLMWTAEPKLNARKQTGFLAVFFLIVLTGLLYITNKRIWGPIKHT